jgi:hypothetical protein
VAATAPTAAPPGSVTLAGSLQSELGCAGDWDPACAATALTLDPSDQVWRGAFTVPAGSWEFKVALDGGWTVNYGDHATLNGPNLTLDLATPTTVSFYYSDATHWVTASLPQPILTAAGSFQSELGCPGDWAPDCLRSWLQDPDGDGTATLTATGIPAGSYDTKVTAGESWDVNWGAGGVPGGANIPFTVGSATDTVTMSFSTTTHVLTVSVTSGLPTLDNDVWWDGVRHDSRDTLYRTPGGVVPAG